MKPGHVVVCLLFAAVAASQNLADNEELPETGELSETGESKRGIMVRGPTQEDLEQSTKVARHVVVPAWTVLFLSILSAALLERFKVHWLPESAVVIFWGIAAGAVMRYRFGWEAMVATLQKFNVVALNLFLLPIIIFESGWSVRMKDFGSQFQYILVFAILGTGICVLIVGTLIHATRNFHGIGDLKTAFAYASLICSTDPVATLATYSSLKVEPLLNIMVFGEALINDAVAIVLFEIMNSDVVGTLPNSSDILRGVAGTFFSSVAIGFASAAVAIVGIRLASMRYLPAMQGLYMVSVGYIVYATADSVGASGIIATLFASLTMNLYLKPHMAYSDELLVSYFIKQLASIGDMGIFLMVGVDASLTLGVSWKFSLWIMLFCLASRAVVIVPLALLVNAWKRCAGRVRHVDVRKTIRRVTSVINTEGSYSQVDEDAKPSTDDDIPLLSWGHMFMMWHAGLRGGIALVLCLQLGEWVDLDPDNAPHTRRTLAQATVSLISVFLLVFGGSTRCCLQKLGIPIGEDYANDHLSKTSVMDCTRQGFNKIDTCLLWRCLVGDGSREEWQESRQEDREDVIGGEGEKELSPRREQTGVLAADSCTSILEQLHERHRSANVLRHLETVDDFACGGESSDGDSDGVFLP